MTAKISVSNLTKAVGDKGSSHVLWKGLNFSVSAGQVVGITGPSGCGKSTLLNCLGLLERPDEGEVFISGIPLASASVRKRMAARRKTVGYLFQDYALIDNETVSRNVASASRRKGRQLKDDISAVLAEVGLEGRESDSVYCLSGGEQQRVAIARLLVHRPEIILADEPTASLDRSNGAAVLTHLRSMCDLGAAAVIVSHDPWVIDQTDRTIQLEG